MALDVDSVRFTPVRIREGYEMSQVDDYLDLVRDTLRSYAAAVAGQGSAPAPFPSRGSSGCGCARATRSRRSTTSSSPCSTSSPGSQSPTPSAVPNRRAERCGAAYTRRVSVALP